MPLPPFTPAKTRVHRRRETPPSSTTPPAAPPVLLHGTFSNEDGFWLYLTFDRAISVTTLVPATLLVIDPGSGGSYNPVGTPSVDDDSITMALTIVGGWSGTQARLDAEAGSGIVSAAGAVPWMGVSGFVLETE